MEQSLPSEPSGTAPETESSLSARLLNVFASPAEVFDEIKGSQPKHSNWIVPLFISIIVGIISALVIFSQPAIVQRIAETQDKAYQKLIQAGTMTQANADTATELTKKYVKYGMAAGAIFINPVMLFLVAAIVFLVGRFAFKGEMNYMQALEVTGLASLIATLGTVLSTLLAVIYGAPGMTPGPILLVGHFDPQNQVHLILSALNAVSLWYIAVLGIGLSRLSGASWLKSTLWLFCIWLVLTLGPGLALSLRKPAG